MTPTAELEDQQAKVRRWPGPLLSLFVPGFGLVRAGRPLRGLAWFVGLQFIGVAAIALLFITRAVPTWVVCTAMFAAFMCFVVMLTDSFRPGRLTWPLIVIFVIVLTAQVALPSGSHLVAAVFKVPTRAMEPTLIGDSHGTPDHVIVGRVSYLISQPQRGDLVVFRTTGIMGVVGDGEIFFVKRLIGLPGERIEIRDGHVLADGRLWTRVPGFLRSTMSHQDPACPQYFRRTVAMSCRGMVFSFSVTTPRAVSTAGIGAPCPDKISTARYRESITPGRASACRAKP